MRPRLRQLALIASLIATGSVSVDAGIYDGEDLSPREILMEKRAERIDVRQVGDVVEATLPWVDQPGIKVKYNLGSTTALERFRDKRNQEALIDNTNFGEGGVKFDIILNEKPNTNQFCYTVEGAENYEFSYQGELTLDEISKGVERKDNIVGSYAVYHRFLKNNTYKTGKAFHIERPQVWSLSDDSNKLWATLSYSNGQLCVTAPQNFLDTADYPVRIDPSIGYDVAGASIIAYSSDGIFFNQITVPSYISSITGMYSYVYASTTGADVVSTSMSLYTASTSALRGTRAAYSNALNINNTPEWKSYTVSGSPTVSTSTAYTAFALDYTTVPVKHHIDSTTNYYVPLFFSTTTSSVSPPSASFIMTTSLSTFTSVYRYSSYFTYTTPFSCDGLTSTCPAAFLQSPNLTADHGNTGSHAVWIDGSTLLTSYTIPFANITSPSAAFSISLDGGGTFPVGPFYIDTAANNASDIVAHSLWDSSWTIATTTRKIYFSTLDSGVDDTYFTVFNLTNATRSPTVLGTTQASSATLGANYCAVTMAENGDLFMASADVTDSWVVKCNATSTGCTTAANWYEPGLVGTNGAIRGNGDDPVLLSPVGGTNNAMVIQWDTSLDTLNYNIWSSTSTSWFNATATIASAIDDNTTYEGQMISLAYSSTTGTTYLAVVDDANDYTSADHDIRLWRFASSTGWVALTNATTTAAGGLQGVNISIDPSTGQLFVAYVRRTTIGTATTANIYWATSTDNGVTWSKEKGPITTANNYTNFGGSPISSSKQAVTFKNGTSDTIYSITYYNPYQAPAGGSPAILREEELYFMQ